MCLIYVSSYTCLNSHILATTSTDINGIGLSAVNNSVKYDYSRYNLQSYSWWLPGRNGLKRPLSSLPTCVLSTVKLGYTYNCNCSGHLEFLRQALADSTQLIKNVQNSEYIPTCMAIGGPKLLPFFMVKILEQGPVFQSLLSLMYLFKPQWLLMFLLSLTIHSSAPKISAKSAHRVRYHPRSKQNLTVLGLFLPPYGAPWPRWRLKCPNIPSSSLGNPEIST